MLVLDANILIRAILGRRVRNILQDHVGVTRFLIADAAVAEVRAHLPGILAKRGLDARVAMALLDQLTDLLDVVPSDTYSPHEGDAKARLVRRDINDWPTAAVALAFGCSVWTEDTDFFGAGIATWTTDRVEIFLRSSGT